MLGSCLVVFGVFRKLCHSIGAEESRRKLLAGLLKIQDYLRRLLVLPFCDAVDADGDDELSVFDFKLQKREVQRQAIFLHMQLCQGFLRKCRSGKTREHKHA